MKIVFGIIGFVIGASTFVFLYWLSGYDIPQERGRHAVFVVVEAFFCGVIGAILSGLLVSLIKKK